MSEKPPPIAERKNGKTLVLFDVDGTLTVPAQVIEKEMLETLARLRKDYSVGIVGAADFEKIQRQLSGDVHDKVDFVFAESGVHAFRDGKLIHQKSIAEHLGAERWSSFKGGLDKILESEKDARQKCLEATKPGCTLNERSTFLEERVCTINITPIGRNPGLTKDERYACEKADIADGLRKRVLEAVHKQYGPTTDFKLHANIGGQIGVDVGVVGWDKTFALQFLDEAEFTTLHFFGDKCEPGGGDYEIYSHKRTAGHAVATWEDTNKQLKDALESGRFKKDAKPAKPIKLRKPKFGKVGKCGPEQKGLNFYLKCVKTAEAVEGTDVKEALCGDDTGTVLLSLRSDAHVALCKAGALIRVQNAHTRMIKGHIRLVVDKWSALKAADSVEFDTVNEEKNISAMEYELK